MIYLSSSIARNKYHVLSANIPLNISDYTGLPDCVQSYSPQREWLGDSELHLSENGIHKTDL